jgi:phosphoribosylformimino-5-aminoimidazole carboxamide ribotide isomerase
LGKVQFGGGLRTLQDIDRVISMGVERVMLGSIAVESPDVFNQALSRFGADHIGLAMDVRSGSIRIRGWTQTTTADPIKVGLRLYEGGLRFCAYTDISRDGGESGLNLKATQRFAEITRLNVIASGGVHDLDDIRKTRAAGLSGVIVGRALYEGRFELEEALSC